MSLRNFIVPRNLIHLQRMAAIQHIDRQIEENWRNGYGVDVDELLDRRKRLVDSMEEPIA